MNKEEKVNKKIYDFTIFSLCFSLCHAAVMSCVAYSSSEFSESISTVSNGSLYVCNALSAFFIAGDFVYYAGPKFSMTIGLIGNCIYVAGFLISAILPSTVWFIFIPSSIIGGLASGLQWTAQGKYFSTAALYYSQEQNLDLEECNQKFAAIFATIYLILEVVFKMIATGLLVLFPGKGRLVIFTIYTIFAGTATFLIHGVSDLNIKFSLELFQQFQIQKSFKSCYNFIVYGDNFIYLYSLYYQFSTGITLSYITLYVYGTIVCDSNQLGDSYVGILAAYVVIIAALISVTSTISLCITKSMYILISGLCTTLLGAVLFTTSNSKLGTWLYIIPYLTLEGISLGIWESINKAIIADLYGDCQEVVNNSRTSTSSRFSFPDFQSNDSSMAFALLYFMFFLGNGLGYYCLPYISRLGIGSFLIFNGIFGSCMYLMIFKTSNDRRVSIIDVRRSGLKGDFKDLGTPLL